MANSVETSSVFAWLLVVALAVATWLVVSPFLSWLLATGLLAFALFPVHRRLEPRLGSRLSAGLLVAVVVGLVVVPVSLGVEALADQGGSFLQSVAGAQEVEELRRTLERRTGLSVPEPSAAQFGGGRLSEYLAQRAPGVLSAGLHAFVGFLLLTFVLYYLLKDGRQFVGWLERVTPLPPSVRDELFASVDDMTWAILKGHILVALVQGAVAGVSLFATGVPRAGLLTVAMMVLAIVPVVGVAPVLGGAVVYLFLNDRLLSAAFVVVWGFSAVAVTDDYLRALLIDRESGMHAAVILVGLAGGTYLLGPMGLFVGPVLVGLFKTTVDVLGRHYGLVEGT